MAEAMNGAPKILGAPVANPVVMALEQILERARAGHITTIAVVALSPNAYFPPVMIGPQRSDLGMGLDMAKATLLAEIFSPPKAGLVRAAEMPGLKG